MSQIEKAQLSPEILRNAFFDARQRFNASASEEQRNSAINAMTGIINALVSIDTKQLGNLNSDDIEKHQVLLSDVAKEVPYSQFTSEQQKLFNLGISQPVNNQNFDGKVAIGFYNYFQQQLSDARQQERQEAISEVQAAIETPEQLQNFSRIIMSPQYSGDLDINGRQEVLAELLPENMIFTEKQAETFKNNVLNYLENEVSKSGNSPEEVAKNQQLAAQFVIPLTKLIERVDNRAAGLDIKTPDIQELNTPSVVELKKTSQPKAAIVDVPQDLIVVGQISQNVVAEINTPVQELNNSGPNKPLPPTPKAVNQPEAPNISANNNQPNNPPAPSISPAVIKDNREQDVAPMAVLHRDEVLKPQLEFLGKTDLNEKLKLSKEQINAMSSADMQKFLETHKQDIKDAGLAEGLNALRTQASEDFRKNYINENNNFKPAQYSEPDNNGNREVALGDGKIVEKADGTKDLPTSIGPGQDAIVSLCCIDPKTGKKVHDSPLVASYVNGELRSVDISEPIEFKDGKVFTASGLQVGVDENMYKLLMETKEKNNQIAVDSQKAQQEATDMIISGKQEVKTPEVSESKFESKIEWIEPSEVREFNLDEGGVKVAEGVVETPKWVVANLEPKQNTPELKIVSEPEKGFAIPKKIMTPEELNEMVDAKALEEEQRKKEFEKFDTARDGELTAASQVKNSNKPEIILAETEEEVRKLQNQGNVKNRPIIEEIDLENDDFGDNKSVISASDLGTRVLASNTIDSQDARMVDIGKRVRDQKGVGGIFNQAAASPIEDDARSVASSGSSISLRSADAGKGKVQVVHKPKQAQGSSNDEDNKSVSTEASYKFKSDNSIKTEEPYNHKGNSKTTSKNNRGKKSGNSAPGSNEFASTVLKSTKPSDDAGELGNLSRPKGLPNVNQQGGQGQVKGNFIGG